MSELLDDLLRHAMARSPASAEGAAGVAARIWAAARPHLGAAVERHQRGVSDASAGELLRRITADDGDAFDALVRRHIGRLLGYARRHLLEHEADDAVQEAFLALLRKAAGLPPETQPERWLFAAVRLEIRRRLARRTREGPIEAEPVAEDGGLPELIRCEDRDRLVEALDAKCSVLEQDVVALTARGWSGARIAQELEISKGHVRVLRHRAYRNLRAALGGDA